MIKILRNFVYIILLSSSFLLAQNIDVSAGIDTTDYLVGDYITYSIKVTYDNGIRVTPPTLTDKLKNLELIKTLPVTKGKDNGKNFEQFNYILSGYDSAEVTIPQIPITYFVGSNSEPKVINTNELVVYIHTLPVNTSAEIKDVKQPLKIELDWKFWLILIFAILAAFIIAYFLYKKFRKPKEAVRRKFVAPPVPVHLIALKALDELKNKKLWQQGKIKDYHSELTEIIRKYFEDRYNFNSLEKTTAENLEILNKVMDNQKVIDTTKEFLTNADMVKFAKFKPIPTVNEEMMKQAVEIVKRTKRDEELQNMNSQNGVRSV
jgi:hypothetical protein